MVVLVEAYASLMLGSKREPYEERFGIGTEVQYRTRKNIAVVIVLELIGS